MPNKRLTEAGVVRMKHIGSGRYTDYQDSAVPGLTLRVYSTGRRNWWHRARGSSHRKKIGDHPEMTLERARQVALDRLSGVDAARHGTTVADLVDHYIDTYRTRTKRRPVTSQTGDALYLRELRDRLGHMAIGDVNPSDVQDYLSRWDGKPYAQNRALQRVRAMYRWASEIDWHHGKMPTRGLRTNRERPRNRCATTDEIEKMLACMDEHEPLPCAAAVRLASVYGWRIGEVLRIRWSDIGTGTITLRDGKNGDDHVVPITSAARVLLEHMLSVRCSDHVFPGRGGRGLGYRAVYDAWRRCLLRTGVEGVTLRDLRHHRASVLLNAKVPARVVASVTGHKDLRVLRASYHDVSASDTLAALEEEKDK